MQRRFYCLLLLLLGLPSLAAATREICGEPPPPQFKEENNESIKGDLEGKANFLSGFVGKAELGGKIESTRKEVFTKYSDANTANIDRYLTYMFCFIIFDPKNKQDHKDKIKAVQEFRQQRQQQPQQLQSPSKPSSQHSPQPTEPTLSELHEPPLLPPPPLRNFATTCVTASGSHTPSPSPLPITSESGKEELIQNGNFKDHYSPEWTAQINHENARIQPYENFVSISFNGEGTGSKAVEFYQVVDVPDPTDLSFYMRVKMSDFDNEGFPIGALAFMDHLDGKVFQITFTSDKNYEPSSIDYLCQISNEQLEEITIPSLLEYVRKKRLPLENYKKITQAKVSFYIAVPSGYRCRRCTIEVYNVSLRYGEKGLRQ